MKKWITGLLCLLLLVFLPVLDTPAEAADYGSCGNNVRWQLDRQTGTLTISGYGAMTDGVWFELDWDVVVKKVDVRRGVTYIGFRAFSGFQHPAFQKLESVSLPDTVKGIGGSAFEDCVALQGIQLPGKLESIGEDAFSGCKNLKTLEIPATVTSIGTNAFRECDALTSIVMPPYVESFGNAVFYGSEALKEVVIPAGVTKLGRYSFYGASGLERVTLPEGLEWIENYAFAECSSLKEIVMPDSVTTVWENAFENCTALERVVLSESLTELRSYVFNGCSALRAIAVPNSVRFIEMYAFEGCTNLETLALARNVTIELNTFMNNNSLKKVFADHEEGYEYDEFKYGTLHPELVYCMTDEGHLHKFTLINPVLPGCGTEGSTVGVSCETCGEVFANVESVPATEAHNYVEGLCSVCRGKDPNYEGVIFTFTDVTEADWFYNPVKWALRTNVTSGISETVFGPYDSCTRAQVVTFLWAANGKPEPAGSEEPFEDVSESDWFYKPVLWAVENGITGGTSETTFSPNAPCTRAQVVTFLWADAGKPNSLHGDIPFNDTFVGDWFLGPVLWAVRNDITGGTGNGMFSPYATCTRGQVVTFLYKAYGTN